MAYKTFFWSENFSYCSGIIKTLNLFDNSIRSIRNVINKNRKIQHSKSLNQTKAFIKPLFSFMTPKNSIKGKSKYFISINNILSASLCSMFLSQKFHEIAYSAFIWYLVIFTYLLVMWPCQNSKMMFVHLVVFYLGLFRKFPRPLRTPFRIGSRLEMK